MLFFFSQWQLQNLLLFLLLVVVVANRLQELNVPTDQVQGIKKKHLHRKKLKVQHGNALLIGCQREMHNTEKAA